MPLREYECSSCGRHQDELFPDEYPSTVECEECGSRATYKIGGTHFVIDFRDGYDPGAGQYFNSNRERNNYIAEAGLRRKR